MLMWATWKQALSHLPQVLEDIDRLLVHISQAINSEITRETLALSYTQLHRSVCNDYELTCAIGQDLLQRLQRPVLSQQR